MEVGSELEPNSLPFAARFCYVPGSSKMNAIMTDFDRHRTGQPVPRNWEGFAEIDQAIRENRLIEYRWKKTRADPWARRLGILVLTLFVIFAGFVIYWDVLRG